MTYAPKSRQDFPTTSRLVVTAPVPAITYRTTGKRVFDLLFLLLIAPAALPLILLLALIVKLDGGPAFYKHRRVGLHGREFDCLKIRTMVPNADARLQDYLRAHPAQREVWEAHFKLENDPRITVIGAFLRKTSLDELPQFLNVLRGELSLVGPRPVTRPEIRKYGQAAQIVLRTHPGMTGLWQVNGRNDTSYEDRVKIDLEYCSSMSALTDLRIILKTVVVMLCLTGK